MEARNQPGDRKLRVAVVAACPFPYPRGTPIRIQRLSNALAARGHEVDIFTYHLGQDSTDDGFTVHRIPRVPTYNKHAPGPSYQKLLVVDPILTVKFFSRLLKRRFDVIHAHHFEGLLVAKVAKMGRRIPLVFDVHNLLGSELPFFNLGFPGSLGARMGRRLDAWLPRLADHVVPVAEAIKERLLQYRIPGERMTVIMNGVEAEAFQLPGATEREPSTLVFTGNLAEYQGLDHLLRALAKVAERRDDVRLVIATQSAFEPYEELARDLGIRDRVEVTDRPFKEQPALLARAAVAVNPRVECVGVPQKLLNYMAAGCPTVSFEGSAPCIEHGETGWLVPGEDIDAFAAGVLHLLDDPGLARRLGVRARETVLERYTWDVAAEKAEAVYMRMLAPVTNPSETRAPRLAGRESEPS